jgi:galactose mutarotase-like enzyme
LEVELLGAEFVMQTDTLRATVLPALGGKVASLRWLPGDIELLQQPLAPYALRNLEMGFEEGDASGIDECLPSVAGCAVSLLGRAVQVPDHGDFWRLEWECTQTGNEMRMAAMGVSLPLRFERVLTLQESTLGLAYRVINVGEAPVEWAWAAHPLFAVERGDRIVLPPSVGQVLVEGSGQQRLGRKGTVHVWPVAELGSGERVDMSVAGDIEEGVGDKLFAASPAEGWAALERAQAGVRIEVQFDAQRSPWLGLWLCYGGWPEGNANRQQCVALEPCTAPMDSLAEAMAAGQARRLGPGESDEWGMRILVSSIS